MKTSKTSVIIGRFQVDELHSGHKYFIDKVIKKRKDAKLIFIIGDSEVQYSNRNPLTFEMRKAMLQEAYPDSLVGRVYDNRSDEMWSRQVDAVIGEDFKNVIIYGSRDSFIPHYKGKHKWVYIEPNSDLISGTNLRKAIGKRIWNNRLFRVGIIHAIENKFPVAYPTVDVAVLRWDSYSTSPTDILLGRKPGRDKFCFIGGFVDPNDSSLEGAAYRELHEEVKNINTHELEYVGSVKVDDFRFKGTKDGIITSLFKTYIMSGAPQPADDIEECKWFALDNFDMECLTEHHHGLFGMLMKSLRKFRNYA